MKLLFAAISFTLFTALPSLAESLPDKLLTEIHNSDILANFWAGDDGEDCYEPTVEIKSIDTLSSQALIHVYQNGSAIGCYEQNWQCLLKFELGDGALQITSTETTLDCQPL